jgi:NADPH:quinone reductase-like Zn-dependent oxidoreductase
LKAEGEVSPGQVVLVPGSGGLALFAVQFGTALGARVISTSSSDAKLAKLAALGAQAGINYRECPDWGVRVRALTDGVGADVVMEIGGEATFDQSVTACRIGGRVLVIGSTGRGAPVLPLRDVIMHHLRVQGMAVGNVALLRELSAFLEHQSIRPVLDRTFGFDELAEAFRYQLSGTHMGKIAIRYD